MSKEINKSIIQQENHFFQAKHLIQIILAVQATLILALVQRVYLAEYVQLIIGLSVLISLIGVSFLAKKGMIPLAASSLLIITTACTTYFMWVNGGMYSPIVFVYPCILIMAAVLGINRLFCSLLVFIALSIALNGILNHYGIFTNKSSQPDIQGAILIILIFILTSYVISVMAKDFRKIVTQLHDENKMVVKSKDEIELLLRHDILTNLPNRLMAKEFFKSAMIKYDRDHAKLHIMFIDLDDFKLMNDALGHEAGDLLLIEISTRLKNTVRGNDLVCRFAGDEFIIIFESLTSPDLVATISQKVISAIKKPFYYQGHEFICGSSIGISIAPDDGEDFEELVRNADTAMYHSKAIGGNSFHYFNSEMNTNGHEYLSLITDLRQTIKEGQLFLVYQPKINLKENKIIGAEALIRWNHPEKGIIFPNDFIEEAEKSGLICEVGKWALQEACTACKDWISRGFKDFTVAVNISSKQFARGDLLNVVSSALDDADLLGKHLELEMTESLLFDNSDRLKNTFKSIQSLGVTFSVDDFGTGYSNLGYLKAFDIASLKIDQSFIYDIDKKPQNKALVKAIIQMARGLELHTVAEGIETIVTADMLADFQCDSAQGYLWSKPIKNDAFIAFSEEFNKVTTL